MIKQHLMLALLGSALVAGPALAQSMNQNQSSGSSSPPAASTTSPSSSSAAAGNGNFMTKAQAGQWRASKLVGVDIYGSNNEKIGDVNEVLIDKDGNAQAVVIGVGGFLGVGQKDIALPFKSVQWSNEPMKSASSNGARSTTGSSSSSTSTSGSSSGSMDYPDHGVVNMTKDQLKNAPEFKYASDNSSRSSSSGSSTAPAAPKR